MIMILFTQLFIYSCGFRETISAETIYEGLSMSEKYYLIATIEPDGRKVLRLLRLLFKRGINVENIVITIRINDNSELGLLGGLKKNYKIILFEGFLPVPRVRAKKGRQ